MKCTAWYNSLQDAGQFIHQNESFQTLEDASKCIYLSESFKTYMVDQGWDEEHYSSDTVYSVVSQKPYELSLWCAPMVCRPPVTCIARHVPTSSNLSSFMYGEYKFDIKAPGSRNNNSCSVKTRCVNGS